MTARPGSAELERPAWIYLMEPLMSIPILDLATAAPVVADWSAGRRCKEAVLVKVTISVIRTERDGAAYEISRVAV